MKELIKKNWEYILYQNNNDFVLSVVCGSVLLFDLEIKLNGQEKENYLQQGQAFIEQLANQIRNNPNEWKDRNIN